MSCHEVVEMSDDVVCLLGHRLLQFSFLNLLFSTGLYCQVLDHIVSGMKHKAKL